MSFNQTIDRLHQELTRLFKETNDITGRYSNAPSITWSWVATQTAQIMNTYPTGLTITTLLADLETMWEQHSLTMTGHNFDIIANTYDSESFGDDFFLDCTITQLTFKHDSILRMATLKDSSQREMDMYLPLKCNPWISNSQLLSRHLVDFGHERRIRFRCPPTMNAPLAKHYYDLTLARSDRVLCCAPTHQCLWQLGVRDTAWIKDIFFKDTFTSVIPVHSMASPGHKRHQLWVKVVHVEQDVERIDNRKRRDVYVIDANDDDAALLCFYDHHIHMTRMLQRGDYLGLYNPVVAEPTTASQIEQTDLVFEYGPDTMLFFMPHKDAIQAGVATIHADDPTPPPPRDGHHSPMHDFFNSKPPIMDRDDEGMMNCLLYVPRIRVIDLEPSMLNITLSGRVIAKANNNPFIGADGKRMDRYAIRIEDETGKVDVTLWEQTGQYAKKIMVGHRLVLTGLSTSVQHQSAKGNMAWYVNGSAVCGTTIHNVSQLECLLVSDELATMTALHRIQGDGQWETEATIVGWQLCGLEPLPMHTNNTPLQDDEDIFCPGDYMVIQAHKECLEMVQENDRCDYCDQTLSDQEKVWVYRQRKQVAVSETSSIGWIEWRLDDGRGTLDTYGAEKMILGCRAQDFQAMTPRSQIALLDSVVGQSYACSISCVGTHGYRLDRVVPARQYQSRCLSLIHSMSNLL